MLETRRRLVDRPCRNHATTDSEPKPARNQTRRELLLGEEDVRAGKPVTDKVRLHQVVTQLQDTDDASGAPGK